MFDFVIELGDSHNGDAERARRLVREAARAGAKGVLLDASRLEDVFAPEVLRVSPAHRRRRLLELPRHEIGPLCAFARTQGLRIGLRPAAMDDVPFAAGLADFLAVGPHEAAWLDLVLHCAETELPLTVGTAMTDASEVWILIQTALEAGCRDLTLLHGIMRRPTPPEACSAIASGWAR